MRSSVTAFGLAAGPLQEPAFYAYAVPAPPQLKDAKVRPDAAFFHQQMGEFILPYDAVTRIEIRPRQKSVRLWTRLMQ